MEHATPIIIAVLVLAAIWGYYLFPAVAGERRLASKDSTEEFGRFTSAMTGVQSQAYDSKRTIMRDTIKARRRRTLQILGGSTAFFMLLAVAKGGFLFWMMSLLWAAITGWYVLMLLQFKQRQAMKVAHAAYAVKVESAEIQDVRLVANR